MQRRVATLVVGLTAVISLLGGTSPASALSIALPPDAEGSAVRNRDGRLEAFGVDLDGRVVTNFQHAIGSGWSGFYPFANDFGARTSTPVASHPLEDGRLMIAWLGNDGFPYFTTQRKDGPGWTAIGRIGETQFTSPPTLVSPPVLARNPDGRLSAFGISASGQLIHSWQTSIDGGFTGWGQMSTLEYSTAPEGAIAVAEDRVDPLMRVYAVTAAGDLVRFVQEQGGFWWSEPEPIPGEPVGRPVAVRQIYRANPLESDLIAYRKASGALGLTRYHPTSPTAAELAGVVMTGAPALAHTADGRIEIFVTGTNGAMYHSFQGLVSVSPYTVDPAFSAPIAFGGPCAGSPNIATNEDGRLEAFCVSTGGALIHTFQLFPVGAWSGFYSLGGTLQA